MEKVGIIIVLYKSESLNYETIKERERTFIILVDNTPDMDLNLSRDNVIYLPQKANLGIAKAQNIGIEKAKELGCTSVLFFDQDSMPTADLVDHLIDDFNTLKAKGMPVAAVGPIIVDKATGETYKSRGRNLDGFRETKSIISSGMTTDMSVLGQVGGMENSLFIDLVDHEWCWRARSRGLKIYISQSVKLPHSVGQSIKSFMGFPIIVSSPFRYYYSYRNALVMMRRRYVPIMWKCKTIIRQVFLLFYIALCNVYRGKRHEIYKNIFRGIKDSIHYGK